MSKSNNYKGKVIRPKSLVSTQCLRLKHITVYIYCLLSFGNALHVFCEYSWKIYPQSGTCVRVFPERKNWHTARQSCKNEGGDLIKILDNRMNQELANHTSGLLQTVYIGLKKEGLNITAYSWLDEKQAASYMHTGTFASKRHLTCVITNLPPRGNVKRQHWEAVQCYEKHGYVCEKTPECEDRSCAGPGKECHYITGWCKFGCQKGYEGKTCDIACSNNTYGENCSETCSPHCGGRNNSCNHVNGSCTSGCVQGFDGRRCEKEIHTEKTTYSLLAMIAAAAFSCLIVLVCVQTVITRHCVSQEEQDEAPDAQYSHLWGILQGATDYGTGSSVDSEAFGQRNIPK